MADIIRLENLRVVYSSKVVLDGLNLSIQPGDFVTVCGQTGCGKSTMLRLILGSERATSGRVLIDGQELPRPDRNRGYVPQKYSLFPDKTVLENITFGPETEEFGLLGRFTPAFFRRREIFAQRRTNCCSRWGFRPLMVRSIRTNSQVACSSVLRLHRR
jgi:NitT/TauT family transport system ATP-binding protein